MLFNKEMTLGEMDKVILFAYLPVFQYSNQGPHGPWKSWKVLEFVKKKSRPGKSLETDKVLESPGIFFQ
jgi:hypothetical protein